MLGPYLFAFEEKANCGEMKDVDGNLQRTKHARQLQSDPVAKIFFSTFSLELSKCEGNHFIRPAVILMRNLVLGH